MTFQIKKATKAQAKLRLAAFGPSGAGKTMTALRIATGLGGRIGVIDTERGSASKYSDRFDFDVIELTEAKDVQTVIGAIQAFSKHGANVLIIDSLSHAWQELLAEIDRLAKARYKGNTWSAWSEGTPLQRSLVDAILDYPGHVIATMRSKTEWTTEKDDRTGKSKPMRVGLAPEQGKGIEYEFDMLMEISTAHVAEFIKDRTGKYQDRLIEKPGEELGRELAEWLSDGAPAPVEKPAAKAAPRASVGDAGEPDGMFPPDPPAGVLDEPEPAPAQGDVTPSQLKALGAVMRKWHLDDREMARSFMGWLFGREIHSSKELSKGEASRIIGWTADQWSEALADYAVFAAGGPPDEDEEVAA